MLRRFHALLILPLLALHVFATAGVRPAEAGVWRGEKIEPAWCTPDTREVVRLSRRFDKARRFEIKDFSEADCSNPRYRVFRIHDRKRHLYWTVPFKGWFLECRCRIK